MRALYLRFVGRYIGSSTRSEIEYARANGLAAEAAFVAVAGLLSTRCTDPRLDVICKSLIISNV
ncbi:MAG: hypothetical protein KBS55_00150 [Bacteroidales bacterium]|nr:hypothetical protein [Candidatus Cryptobacteroides aphodequi]